jgi:hypothetical protein
METLSDSHGQENENMQAVTIENGFNRLKPVPPTETRGGTGLSLWVFWVVPQCSYSAKRGSGD